MKQLLPLIFLICILCISGIGRHDTKISAYTEFAQNKAFDCVGSIYYDNAFQLSCVLIDSTHIITAAHAFEINNNDLIFDSVYEPMLNQWHYGKHPTSSYIAEPSHFYIKLGDTKYTVKKIYVNDTYKNAKPIRDSLGIHPSLEMYFDIAIAELETPVNTIIPATLYNDSNELNEKGLFVGYGDVAKSDDVNKKITFRRRQKFGGENMIDSIGGYKVGNIWAGLYFDFDAPHSDCCNRMGSAIPLPLEYFPHGGDCGSALFLNNNGKYYLAGICAGEDVYWEYILYAQKYGMVYGHTANYQRIYAYKNWITETLNQN